MNTHKNALPLSYNIYVHMCIMVVLIFIILILNTGCRNWLLKLWTNSILTYIAFVNRTPLEILITFDSYLTISKVQIYQCTRRLYLTIFKVWTKKNIFIHIICISTYIWCPDRGDKPRKISKTDKHLSGISIS